MRRGNHGALRLGIAAGLAVFGPRGAAAADAAAIRIGVNTAIQRQVGRHTLDAVNRAIDEINARGGGPARRLESILADEGEAASDGP